MTLVMGQVGLMTWCWRAHVILCMLLCTLQLAADAAMQYVCIQLICSCQVVIQLLASLVYRTVRSALVVATCDLCKLQALLICLRATVALNFVVRWLCMHCV